ncbi:hypothetical protein SH528x_003432 [Novipirellula sp. SH528]|uniref:hypothetical protein n=1 Tax=Novipirellula sp. SH528 TaxID=3454466 RepID=UPI003FA09659
MAKLYENSFYRRKISTRRGVWTTWSAPQTWSSWLIRSAADDVLAELSSCDCVLNISDVTESVATHAFVPPSGHWSLLVQTPHQRWATFADQLTYNESLEPLRKQFRGDVLTTGAIDDSGVFYVRLWTAGSQKLELVTDGMGWPTPPEDIDDEDEDEEDYRSIFEFVSDKHEADWPHSFDRSEEAHQQLIIDLDAYVPHFYFADNALGCSYEHRDAADMKKIDRVSLVELSVLRGG